MGERAIEDGFERVGDDDLRSQAVEEAYNFCADDGFAEGIFAVVGEVDEMEVDDALSACVEG